MEQNLTDTIYTLQKNVLELHNLFDLNMVANQSRTIEDLLSKIADLVKASLGLKSLRFFLSNNGLFQTKNILSDSDLEFEFLGDNAPFLQNETEELITTTSKDGNKINNKKNIACKLKFLAIYLLVSKLMLIFAAELV